MYTNYVLVGKKKFLFGDKSCEFDCTMFGMVAQYLLHMPGSPIKSYIEGIHDYQC